MAAHDDPKSFVVSGGIAAESDEVDRGTSPTSSGSGLAAENADGDRDRAVEPQRVASVAAMATSAPQQQRTRNKIRFSPASQVSVHESGLLDDDSTRSRELIRREIDLIIAAEAPILQDRLVEVLAARFDLSRVRESRRRQLEGFLGRYPVRRAANGDAVVWPRDEDPNNYTKFRLPADGAKREIRQVPYEELRNAMIYVAKSSHGVDEESLLREVSRMFGAGRMAALIKARLESVLEASLRENFLIRQATAIRPVERL